jgi:uncharacterized DUF497 family protein
MGETEDFEWDDAKNIANLEKHGVPLRFAILLFDDPYLVRFAARQIGDEEVRQIAVGRLGKRILACVYALRGARKRLISLRAARRSERRVYAAQIEESED